MTLETTFYADFMVTEPVVASFSASTVLRLSCFDARRSLL